VAADPNAHVWGEWTDYEAATCTEDGTQIRFCSENSAHYEIRIVTAPGHSWGEWITVTEATSASDGLERRVCLRCDEVEERSVQFVGEQTRQIQFVVMDDMYYIVHMDEDRSIHSKTAKAIYWYEGADLNFEVVTDFDWKYDGYEIRVNGSVLQPNADGTFTLPGGTDYAQINIYPVSEAANTVIQSGVCKYCGKVHPSHLWGQIIAFFHAILYFFKNLFSR